MLKGTIIQITRRHASIYLESGQIVDVQLLEKFIGLTLGDVVIGRQTDSSFEITSIEERRNTFKRALGERKKEIAANVDQIYIVSAVAPLFNTIFIDRVIATAISEAIPVSLILNKVDLGTKETEALLAPYKKISLPIFQTSAKENLGLDTLFDSFKRSHNKIIALCGISGVGKSTIINRFFNNDAQRTGVVSDRTGQGKQTTTEATASPYLEKDKAPLFLVDLPGIQNFGVSHLTKTDLNFGFSEFQILAINCAFRDCSHTKEERCAIKDAVSNGLIAASRYESYLNILAEINSIKRY